MKCPHCLVEFHDNWSAFELYRGNNHQGAFDSDGSWSVETCRCAACKRLIIRLKLTGSDFSAFRKLIQPKGIARAPLSADVPEEFASDYREACLVLDDSAKASAALSRRCLQHLLREKAGVKKADLVKEIEEVLPTLPSHLAQAVDAIRQHGNFAAHPLKSTNTGEILDVEPGEAEWSLDVLEGLFDHYFVQPALLQKKRDELNKKLTEAGKPPMK